MVAGFVTFVVLVALLLTIAMPTLTFVHELAHAVVAAALIPGPVTLVQGPSPARLRLRWGTLDVRVRGPVAPHQGMVGWAVWSASDDPWRHAAATAAGPMASAASAVAAASGAVLAGGIPGELLWLIAAAATLQALSSGLPVRYGRWFGAYAGEASDGLRVRQLMRGTPEPAPVV